MSNLKQDNTPNLEVSASDSKLIQDMIDSILIENPAYRAQLTVSQVWQYKRMPDYVYGWPADKGPMPDTIKVSLIIRTLKLGFTPGMGEIIWIGNTAFITAAARAFCVSQSGSVKAIGKQTFRPFNDAEKKMFGISEGDLNCVVEQLHANDGNEFEWSGHGVIDASELSYVDKNGQKKTGMKTSHQVMQTLKTRAIADMNRRNFPIYGLQDSGEVSDFFGAQIIEINEKTPKGALVMLDKVETVFAQSAPVVEKPVFDEKKHEARYRFSKLAIEIKNAKGDIDQILGEDCLALLNGSTAERISDACDVLESWLDAESEMQNNKPPIPIPPPEKTARRAGRPSKAQSRFKKLETSVGELGGVPDTILKLNALQLYNENDPDALNLASDTLEAWIDDKAEKPQPARAIDGALKADHDEIEPWDNGEMPADPLAESETMSDAEWQAKFPEAQTENDLELESDPDEEIENKPEIYIGTPKQLDAINKAADKSGLIVESAKHALGVIMRNRPMSELNQNIDALVAQVMAEKPAPAEPSYDPIENVSIPSSGAGAAAYAMLNKSLSDSKVSNDLKYKIKQLISRKLKDGDHLYLPKALREAKSGSFKELDNLIATRESRV